MDQTALQKESAQTHTQTALSLRAAVTAHSKLLADAMKKYKEEMSERRKYFNLVQELRVRLVFAGSCLGCSLL